MAHRLGSVRSYALYYGFGGEEILSQYDLAIVDPGGHDADGLRRLKAKGTLALAYISILEVNRRESGAPPHNVLRLKGQPMAKEEFDNWVLDPRSPLTSQRLLGLAEELWHRGYDGLFLDTIGDVEDRRFAPGEASELVVAASRLVRELHFTLPEAILVQNWGLHRLLPLTATWVDGVCWEEFPYKQVGPVPAVHSGIRTLQAYQDETRLRVLALNQAMANDGEREAAASAAERCNFLWYGTTDYLHLPGQVLR